MKTKIIEMTQNAYNHQSEEISGPKKLTFKILKNRNGQNDRLCKANIIPERFCITNETSLGDKFQKAAEKDYRERK